MISTIDLFPSKLILCQMSQNAGSSEKVQTVVLFYWTGMFYFGMKASDFFEYFLNAVSIAETKSVSL